MKKKTWKILLRQPFLKLLTKIGGVARRSPGLGRVVGLERSQARRAARTPKGRSARSLAARHVHLHRHHQVTVQSLRQSPAIRRLCPRPIHETNSLSHGILKY